MIKALFICLSILISTPAWSQRLLKAAIFEIPPWGYRDSKGKISGIEYDVIQAISKEIGEDINITLVPYKRMMYLLEAGLVDFSIFFRGERSEEVGIPLAKWGELDIIIVGKKGKEVKTYSDLKKYTTCVRLGGYFDPKFDRDTKIRKHDHKDYSKCVTRVMNDKSDLVVGTAATLFYEFKKQGVDISQLSTPYFLSVKEDWLHFSRKSGHQGKKEVLIKAVNKLVKDGTFAKIFSKHLPKKWQHK